MPGIKLTKYVNDLETWCLQNGEFGQQVINEWTGELENGEHVALDGITFGSNKKAKWKCSKGHEWFATVNNRTTGQHSCPYCAGKTLTNLKTWCSNNADFGQQLLSEWTGELENGERIEPDKISIGSNKKVKWKCSKGHEWFATVCKRTGKKHSCPYCSGRLTTELNCLKTWCLQNGEFGQQLINEWIGELDTGEQIKLDEISFGSHRKVKWKCSRGHEWYAAINARTGRKQNCPYCSGTQVSELNSLKNWCLQNRDFGKQLTSEWTGELENGQHIEMDEISFGSARRVKWKCSKGHEWYADVGRRTHRMTGCPYCTQRITPSLNTWCTQNGAFGRQLLNEWTGELENGESAEITDILINSPKRVKWKCSKGHEWYTQIYSRIRNKVGCPYCFKPFGVKNSNSFSKWCQSNGDYGKKLISEWTGELENGTRIKMNEIAYGSGRKLKWICSKGHEWFASLNHRTGHKSGCPHCFNKSAEINPDSLQGWCTSKADFGKQLMSEWTGELGNGKYIEANEIAFDSNIKVKWKCSEEHEWYAKIVDRTAYKSKCPYCNLKKALSSYSLKKWCADRGKYGTRIIREWTGELEKGGHIEINKVSYTSSERVKWKCAMGHVWYASIDSRTHEENACPHCIKRKFLESNNFNSWCLKNKDYGQQLLSEWTGELENEEQADIFETAFNSDQNFKWICANGHEWYATVDSRTRKKTWCPHCEEQRSLRLKNLDNWCSKGDFGQQLREEWTGELENGEHIEMNKITFDSTEKVKWKCSKGHEWYQSIVSRTGSKTRCPNCYPRASYDTEKFLYQCFKQLVADTRFNCRIVKSTTAPGDVKFSIGIPSLSLCIDYLQTSSNTESKEIEAYKKKVCEQNKIRYIRVIEDNDNELEHKFEPNYICFKTKGQSKEESLIHVLDYILKTLGRSVEEINMTVARKKAYDHSKGVNNE